MTEIRELLKIQHDIQQNYSKPKIYDCGGKVGKGNLWYLYFSFRNPKTGKMERQPNIYLNVNRIYKTPKDRRAYLKGIQLQLERNLRNGWIPLKYRFHKTVNTSIRHQFQFALDQKKLHVGESTYTDYKSRCNQFIQYCEQNGYYNVSEINNKLAGDYLAHVLKKSSARNRNNTKRVLSTLSSILSQNDVVNKNYFKGIDDLQSKPVRHKAFTEEEAAMLFEAMKGTSLLLYVKFVSYLFLRPVEVCRLTWENVNLSKKYLIVKAKENESERVLIPRIIISELNPSKGLVFTDSKASTPQGRRNYYTEWFRKIKNRLGFGSEYDVYSFRHHYTSRVFNSLISDLGREEALNELQLITRHKSRGAMLLYLRNEQIELPKDYSDRLR